MTFSAKKWLKFHEFREVDPHKYSKHISIAVSKLSHEVILEVFIGYIVQYYVQLESILAEVISSRLLATKGEVI